MANHHAGYPRWGLAGGAFPPAALARHRPVLPVSGGDDRLEQPAALRCIRPEVVLGSGQLSAGVDRPSDLSGPVLNTVAYRQYCCLASSLRPTWQTC